MLSSSKRSNIVTQATSEIHRQSQLNFDKIFEKHFSSLKTEIDSEIGGLMNLKATSDSFFSQKLTPMLILI